MSGVCPLACHRSLLRYLKKFPGGSKHSLSQFKSSCPLENHGFSLPFRPPYLWAHFTWSVILGKWVRRVSSSGWKGRNPPQMGFDREGCTRSPVTGRSRAALPRPWRCRTPVPTGHFEGFALDSFSQARPFRQGERCSLPQGLYSICHFLEKILTGWQSSGHRPTPGGGAWSLTVAW